MRRKFQTLDVFTERRFGGNPLAVVIDSEGLSGDDMQRIAREFNLSETIFLLEARDPVNTARVRIFTPGAELPFAGHPTIGAAVAIGLMKAPRLIQVQDVGLVIEEEIGAVSCTVRQRKGRQAEAEFILPHLPQRLGDTGTVAEVAQALSLDESDIGFDDHQTGVWSAGVALSFIPVASLAAVARARVNLAHWDAAFPGEGGFGALLYTKQVSDEGHHVHARMFAPKLGIAEDPATGSAAAAFAGVCMAYEKPEDGEHLIVIEQGYEMGRPSQIMLKLSVVDGVLQSAAIGGAAVPVMEGTIEA
ncbi:PhzF family phenazine biosynthesis protein [Methylocella sp. CPCC 101449]|jgi:trans-2,3-dihydro-3-hydroxyanthranilate isomerase|uniref:PhzF family phenazine biosynthesis protein n=1 Tax=Methylocella sp. CPCC 101449 TaxID=2987531 RepID=UPI0028922A4A|nr:PhzF family phenazine biosynthesis protein [Methylocella sp. CPCC 101449]MDT2023287.1 PhzF family phenazine biosynthesis protein [Methylocella sp. CPCC 101449]HEV2574177.1 PhzF family phenazine biosynthesis protein [Beijerinckiaceae bacterium]